MQPPSPTITKPRRRASPQRALQRYATEAWAIAQRILTELFRRRRSLIFWAIFPAIILWLNGSILAERAQISTAEAYANAAPASLVGAALFFSCLGGSVSTVVAEREQQTLKRLFMSPLSGLSYFLGIFLAHGAIALGQSLVVILIALSVGADFQGNGFLALLIVALSVMAYVGVGFILGTQFARRTEDVNALVAAFGVPLLILGGVFLPARFFPQSLLNLAQYNPVFHMNEALVAVVAEGEGLSDMGNHFWFLAAFALAVTVTGWLSYRRMVQTERQL